MAPGKAGPATDTHAGANDDSDLDGHTGVGHAHIHACRNDYSCGHANGRGNNHRNFDVNSYGGIYPYENRNDHTVGKLAGSANGGGLASAILSWTRCSNSRFLLAFPSTAIIEREGCSGGRSAF